MALSDDLLKKLGKTYEPASMVHMKHRGKDIAFKTDSDGNPVQLFIGKLGEDGNIKGERYARKTVRDRNGVVIKDHWDNKGRAY